MDSSNSFHLQQNFPLVIKNKIQNWKMLHYTQQDWCNVFKSKPLRFRQGEKKFTKTPHWEHLCGSKDITLDQFFELSTNNLNYWLYFDYKYIKDVLPERDPFINDINWSDVGLSGLPAEESVLWIGNRGAHTPCHKDTYGCNLVAQLFGRKLWILMPPEETENLKPVRVPYEESSIYSHLNFYVPGKNLLNIKTAYRVVLSPGDVLYVPRHWWHYVENLEPAISINIWIPLEEDHESRLEESLVQHYISTICQNLSEEEAKQILNPNEYGLISEPCTISLIEKCLLNYKMRGEGVKKNPLELRFEGESDGVEKLSMESYITQKTLKENKTSPGQEFPEAETNRKVCIAKTLINAYCREENINLIKKALLEEDNFVSRKKSSPPGDLPLGRFSTNKSSSAALLVPALMSNSGLFPPNQRKQSNTQNQRTVKLLKKLFPNIIYWLFQKKNVKNLEMSKSVSHFK